MASIRLNTKTLLLAVVAVSFLAVPWTSNSILYATDNLVVRGLLIAACVGALYVDMFLGLLVFLLVARLFLERNNRKLSDAKAVIASTSAPNKVDVTLPDTGGEIADTNAHVDRQVYSPSGDELPYIPGDETGSDAFHAVDSSLDEKRPLTGVPEGEAAADSVFSNVHPPNFTNEL